MSVRIPDFYLFPAFGGPTLAQQYPNLRNSFGWLNAVMRNSYIDESSNLTTHVLNALSYGELLQRFKFRWRYDASNDEFQLQQNSTDNEASPTWTTLIKIRESDGRVTIVSLGGLLVTGGFYNLGQLDVAVTQAGGGAFGDVGTLLFNSNDGFYLTPDSTGRPIVNVNAAAASGTITTISNEGSGSQIFKQKVSSTAQLRTLTAGTNITLQQNSDDIQITASDTGEVNTASNLGAGFGIWFDKQGSDLRFKSLVGADGVNLSASSTEITITAPEFYLEVKESEAGGYRKRTPKVAFDSSYFYVDSGGSGVPTVSMAATVDTASNLGSGSQVFSSKSGNTFQFRTILAGNNILVSQGTNEVTIESLPGFYPGVIFKESEVGGYAQRDDVLNVDSSFFYIETNGRGKPVLSLAATVDTISSLGGTSLVSGKVGNDFQLKGLTAGTGISLGSSASAVTITNTFAGATVRETGGSPSFSSIDTFSFLRDHFYLSQGTDLSEVVVALRESFPFLFRESEQGGYSKKTSGLVLDSSFFYLDDSTSGTFASLKNFSDMPAFAASTQGKNAIINGNFDVWQRGTTFNQIDNFKHTADRWQVFYLGSTGVDGVDIDRSTFTPKSTVGTGTSRFSYQVTVDTADASISGDECYAFCQSIEGYNIQRFGFGTSDVQNLTLSFWVRNNITGRYSVFFRNALQSTARTYIAEYTVNAVNTWEQKSIPLRADAGGSWGLANNLGLVVGFVLACGATLRTTPDTWQNVNAFAGPNQPNFMETVGNTVRFSRIQVEVGSQATEFERRHIASEYNLCQRYYAKTFAQLTTPVNGSGTTGAVIGKGLISSGNQEPTVNWFMPDKMRATPTITLYNTREGGAPGQWQDGPFLDSLNARVISSSDTVTVVDNTGIQLSGANQAFIHIAADAEI